MDHHVLEKNIAFQWDKFMFNFETRRTKQLHPEFLHDICPPRLVTALNSAASRDGAGRGLERGWDEDQGLGGEMQHAAWHRPHHILTLAPHPTPAKSLAPWALL